MLLPPVIAVSKATLPIASVVMLIVFIAMGIDNHEVWYSGLCVIATAVVMEMVNHRHVLIRGFSRFIACHILLLSAATITLTPTLHTALVQMLIALYFLLIFPAYQQRHVPHTFFFAYVAIGLASLLWGQILFFVPFLWLMEALWLLSPAWRHLSAAIQGLVLPYLFFALYALCTHDWTAFTAHFAAIVSFEPLFDGINNIPLLVSLAVITVMNVVAAGHYVAHSHAESIKNRMLYNIFFMLTILAITFTILCPQHCEPLLRLLVLLTAVNTAHLFSVAKDKLTQYLFLAFLLILATAITYQFL